MAKPKKLKAPALTKVPADRTECAAQIRQIGDLQRDAVRLAASMNDQIAEITARFQPELEAAALEIKTLSAGVQAYCEAHRAELTDGLKVKTANLVTGDVAWRAAPPSVKLTNVEAVLKTLRTLGLVEFIRTKEEVDKEAILANHAAAPKVTPDAINGAADEVQKLALIRTVQAHELLQGLSGIRVVSGIEDFTITPFEQTAEVAA